MPIVPKNPINPAVNRIMNNLARQLVPFIMAESSVFLIYINDRRSIMVLHKAAESETLRHYIAAAAADIEVTELRAST